MTAVSERGPELDDERGDGAGPSVGTGRHRRLRALIAAGAVVVLAVVAVWVVAFSPLLGVGTVLVRGARTVPLAQIEQAAGIARGTPLVRVDTGAIATRVERLAAVRTASVTTTFPSTVTIDVVERRAVGFLSVDGRHELVDTAGVRFRTVSSRPHLPLLVLPADADRATTAAVAAVAASLPATLLRRVASVQALDPQAITLLLHGDRVVHWGSATESAAKARVLPVLLHHGATTVDVSDPANPFTRN